MSLWGTFERALIWNATREAFYQQRQQRRGRQRGWAGQAVPLPAALQPNTVLITFECMQGHQHQVRSELGTLEANEERILGREKCPECRSICRWRTMDYRQVNANSF